jgi:hypothetical protein
MKRLYGGVYIQQWQIVSDSIGFQPWRNAVEDACAVAKMYAAWQVHGRLPFLIYKRFKINFEPRLVVYRMKRLKELWPYPDSWRYWSEYPKVKA